MKYFSSVYPELEIQVSQALDNEKLKNVFTELTQAGDRCGMIKALLDIPSINNFQITDHYRPKDTLKSEKLLQQARILLDSNNNNENGKSVVKGENSKKISAILNDALAYSAPCAKNVVFYEIILQRARFWQLRGNLARCVNDCKYLLVDLASKDARDGEFMDAAELRIDALLMCSDCCKVMGFADQAKNYLNEAMQRISEMARMRWGGDGCEDDFCKLEKVKIFKEFLKRKQVGGRSWDCVMPMEISKQLPAVDGKCHEFLKSCSDAVALGYDETKGRYLYATRNIKPGVTLIVDRPFSFSTDVMALQRNCLNCHVSLRLDHIVRVPCECCQTVQFCSEKCRQHAWNKFHKYECRIFDYFYETALQKSNCLLAYRTVVTAAFNPQNDKIAINEEFLKLHENDKQVFDIKSSKHYESEDYKTVFCLENHCSVSDSVRNLKWAVHSIFFAKCLIYSLEYYHSGVDNHERHLVILAVALLRNMQAINCNAYEIVENVRNDETKILEPRDVGGAIYTSVSLTNHSCYPNIVRHSFPCGVVVVKSIRFIPKGSEVLDCYGQHFLENKRDSRHKLLAQKYFFNCQCEACSRDWPMSLPNDQFNFKCKKCSKQCRRTRNAAECTACDQKVEINKLYNLLQNSIKKRLTALTKMYDNNYQDALPLLIEHASCVDEILSDPNLEAVKTQQSIIQCLNAMSSTSI